MHICMTYIPVSNVIVELNPPQTIPFILMNLSHPKLTQKA